MPDKPSIWSYTGAGLSVMAGLTLTEWGIIAGIITAILTFSVNAWFQHRRDQREQLIHDLKVERLRSFSE